MNIRPALNSDQVKVLQQTEGPVLVIAGPGSGKTKTLVERVVSLVNKGISPRILWLLHLQTKRPRTYYAHFKQIVRVGYKSQFERNVYRDPAFYFFAYSRRT